MQSHRHGDGHARAVEPSPSTTRQLLAMKFSIAPVLLLVGVLTSTGCRKDPGTTPAPTYSVEVRLTGTDGAALGPVADVSIKHDLQPDQHLQGTVVPENGTLTLPIGNAKPTDEMIVEVGFTQVDQTSTVQLRPNSKITGEIIINGQVKATVVLDKSFKYWTNTYASNTVRVMVSK